jgi:hypothetical protein
VAWEKGKSRKPNAKSRPKAKRVPGASSRILPENRSALPLPREMRDRLPFLADLAGRRLIAPWSRELPGDADRLLAVLKCIANIPMPGKVCWCWPDRAPEPVDPRPGWLISWMRDRMCYRLDLPRQESGA